MDIHLCLIQSRRMKGIMLLILALLAGSSAVVGQELVAPKPVVEFLIDVSADGDAIIDGKPIRLDVLADRLRDFRKDLPDLAVKIRGHVDAKYGDVVRVIEVCKKAGVTNISFAARKDLG